VQTYSTYSSFFRLFRYFQHVLINLGEYYRRANEHIVCQVEIEYWFSLKNTPKALANFSAQDWRASDNPG